MVTVTSFKPHTSPMMISAIFLLCFLYAGGKAGKNREYWFAISERTWDYAPSGFNVISGKPINEDEQASIYLKQDTNRIGRICKKVTYNEYTDGSYTEEKKKPDWLGLLGPIIKAEICDNITIHLFNNASRPYSIHAHGVRYTKGNEGGFYPDNTSGNDKNDDHVPPGKLQTYTWQVVEDQGPTEWDDDCITRIYHSHYDSVRDTYSGLVGTMIICKPGVLEKKKKKREEAYVLMFTVMDENLSWYLVQNINNYCTNPASVDTEDVDFQESNLKHSINGYVFGNLPGLSVCDNIDVKWYIFSVGNELDVHSVYFYGNVLTYQHRRVDTLSLFPASMTQASMNTENIGKWFVNSQVTEHLQGGMQAIYEVRNCSKVSPCPQCSTIRRYYIAAIEAIWDYGPTSINQFTAQNLTEPGSESATYFVQNDNRIGGCYMKALYREFTDSTFTKEKPRSKKEIHLGMLGPLIRVQVGDKIEVIFKNKASRTYNIQAHGVSNQKDIEGAVHEAGDTVKGFATKDQNGQSSASHVAPGGNVTYRWTVPESVAPTKDDPDCIAWLYFSSVDPVKDTYSGLVGPLLVCKTLTDTDQTGADNDFIVMPTVFDENQSWYIHSNINQFTGNPESVDVEDPDFQEANTKHSINGYMYGNQPGLNLCVGHTVRWHFLGLGAAHDIHGIHLTGNTFQLYNTTRDVVSISPHVSLSAVMRPDNEGVFNVECVVADHYTAGMRQHYRVDACGKSSVKQSPASRIVTYFIAAEEIDWNYSPSRDWEYAMYPDSNNRPGDIFLNRTNTTIGPLYKKVVYRGYTDETFKSRKRRTKQEVHLGIQGPILYANIGDKIKVIFMNKATRTYSMYAHGLKPESNTKKPTKPGHTETYVWDVPERAGPNKDETDCLTWAYYSDVDPVKDTYSGLIGTIVICKRSFNPIMAQMIPILRFALLFMIFDESRSWYIEENIKRFCLSPNEVDKGSDEFIESNKKHSINGRMYANAVELTMKVGDHVVWHIMGMGNEVDIHTAHWHGHSLIYTRGRKLQADVFDFLPGTFQTASMNARSPGTWLLHCHVDDHLYGGMVTVYTVLEK
ncbi:ceruloplasmin-like [Aquarana catesbeiana]|uniref:ceruloplasmin-like n=1 Tax=Aquarana catesbeiana TaxID=8400 RepID=UPI003CC95611